MVESALVGEGTDVDKGRNFLVSRAHLKIFPFFVSHFFPLEAALPGVKAFLQNKPLQSFQVEGKPKQS